LDGHQLIRRATVSALLLAVWASFSACRNEPTSGADSSKKPATVVFYGFSILGEAMSGGIFPAFQQKWQADGHGPVTFTSSFAGSGTITNQIALGAPAQLALLSLESDADRLADAKVIPDGSWKRLPHGGVVNRTPFVIFVRPGNPRGVHDFVDLTRDGVKIVHPDPLTSGGANWAIVAEYGAGAREHPERATAGEEMLAGIWKNVAAQAASARAARTQFENGFGDALITYEQEALYDKSQGKLHVDVVYPRRTILSEHTLVVIDKNVPASDKALIDTFAQFLWSEEAQKIFVKYGFRSVNEEWNEGAVGFAKIADPFRISDFGGWKSAKKNIVEGVWKKRVLKIEEKK